MTPEQVELNDATHRAIGRFVASFSNLLFNLEAATVKLIDPPPGLTSLLTNAALAGRTADPIVSAFFSVFHERWSAVLADNDKRIMKALRKEIVSVVEERNRLMHDTWLRVTRFGDPAPQPMSKVRIRAHGQGVELETIHYPPEQLDALTEKTNRLAAAVFAAVWGCPTEKAEPCIHERFEVVGGEVHLRRLKDE